MKPPDPKKRRQPEDVAPFAGAWIETPRLRQAEAVYVVAPFAGAWIETRVNVPQITRPRVAPFAGAWIETLHLKCGTRLLRCRPLRGGVD